jgi:Cu+-exporting ATPase
MAGRAVNEGGPVSASFCPACNKPIDALRAGQVAILDGQFRYFCDAKCKGEYVEVLSKRPALDAMTAQPPPVASGVRSSEPKLPPEEIPDHDPPPAFPPPEEARAAPPVSQPRIEEEEPPSSRRESEPVLELSPRTQRSPEPEEEEAAPKEEAPSDEKTEEKPEEDAAASDPAPSKRDEDAESQLLAFAPFGGVALGVLAGAVSLAGEAASFVQLPLALAAAAVFVVVKAMSAREQGEPSPLVMIAPVVVGALAAISSSFGHHVHADAHAAFVGLAAASALIVDVLLSRARKDVAVGRARTRLALAVKAKVVRGDGVLEEGGAHIKPGEQVVVEAGETIAVDGIVAAGDADVAPWLESPALLRKAEGDAVVAGAVVVSGRLRINATFAGNDRAWLRRIDVSAPLVQFARRSVERGAPVAAAIVAAAVYADNGSWLDVIVAASASGLALGAFAAVGATALAHGRGHASAQKRGIVYKDSSAFDAAARADIAVLCSRGTVLLGEPEIVAVEPITKDGVASNVVWKSEPKIGARGSAPPASPEIARVLALAAGAEMASNHPFASAVLREARARGVRPENVRSALGHSGLGVTALAANGDRVIVGSRAFLLQEKVSVAIADARTSALEAEGRSVLLVALGGRLVGLLALQDGLRAGARAAVQRLHDARIEPVLLSGESRDTSETIGHSLDIEHVRPEILPADRGAEVRALADDGRIVACVGHASSDDGALGAADVSIAMEAAGAAPGEWAVALASDDIRDAALALTVPRAARDRSRTALLVGVLAQAAGAVAIAFGVAPPAIIPVVGVAIAAVVLSVARESSPSEA